MSKRTALIGLAILVVVGIISVRHYFSPGEVVKRKLIATIEAFEEAVIALEKAGALEEEPDVNAVLNIMLRQGTKLGLLAAHSVVDVAEKQLMLEEKSPRKRLQMLSKIVMRELDVFELGQKLQTRVRKSIDKDQRDYYLRQQLKAIQRELGEVDEAALR